MMHTLWTLLVLADVSAGTGIVTVSRDGRVGDMRRRPLTVVFERDADPAQALKVLSQLRTSAVPRCRWGSDSVSLTDGRVELVFRFDPDEKLFVQPGIALLLSEVQARGSRILGDYERAPSEALLRSILAVKQLYRDVGRRVRPPTALTQPAGR